MTFIRPINVNAQGINSAPGFAPNAKPEEKEKKETITNSPTAEKAPVSPDKVLDFLAQSAVTSIPKKIDPSKYVDKASEERIASFMASFEDKVAEGLKAFDKEFPGVSVSESTKMAVALKRIDREA